MEYSIGDIVTIMTPNHAGEGEIGVIEYVDEYKEIYLFPEHETIYSVRLESDELVWCCAKDLMKL